MLRFASDLHICYLVGGLLFSSEAEVVHWLRGSTGHFLAQRLNLSMGSEAQVGPNFGLELREGYFLS